MSRILLIHSPETLANYYGARAVAGLKALGDVVLNSDEKPLQGETLIATPHTAGFTLPAIEHQAMETVAQATEILKGRAPKGAVNADHWTRKTLLKT